MPVLVDTSVWIEFFRSSKNSEQLDFIIDENLALTNDLILAELVPFLKIKKQNRIVKLLYNVNRSERVNENETPPSII